MGKQFVLSLAVVNLALGDQEGPRRTMRGNVAVHDILSGGMNPKQV